jgi:tryptophanyl-tRNA synthetase
MRPTGRLHLGNYMGALHNWVNLQQDYDCYFFIADLHALTTDYANTSLLQENIKEVALDFLAAGLDPGRTVIFKQSQVMHHAQLAVLLGMMTPLPWLERVPTYKDQQEQLREKDLNTYGFLGYPLLQAADILLYKPHFVPVGADQEAHVELTREVARRFTFLYPKDRSLSRPVSTIKGDTYTNETESTQLVQIVGEKILVKPLDDPRQADYDELILPEPRVLLTPSPKLPGLDGRKMSKSYNNTIMLSEPPAEVRAKLKTMVTDPARVRRTDPGNPDVCPVFDLHKVFSSEETQRKAAEGCRSAGIGCIECKSWVADAIVEKIAPIQARREDLLSRPSVIADVLANGKDRAIKRAQQTLDEVEHAIGLR